MGKSVFIAGGGPSGLAAALLFHQLGWDEITLAERRASPQDFEKNKAFNYQIDARGQKLLRRLGIHDRLQNYGVANTAFTATTIAPDSSTSIATPPIIDAERPQAFWSTRRMLLTMLHEAVEERNDGRITLLYGHKVLPLAQDGLAVGKVAVASEGDGEKRTFSPDLIVACDGLGSVIRRSASNHPNVPEDFFAMVEHPSISAQLQYKVLNLPAQFATRDDTVKVDNNRMTYIINSRDKERTKACSLFSFPVTPGHPRTVNLIREKDHILWTFTEADQLLDYLGEAFPQVDLPELIGREEAEDFVALQPGQFPEPQYASNILARLEGGEKPVDLLLIGDAAHAFPPDLGLGVNSALEDLDELAQKLEASDDAHAAVAAFAEKRLPENKSLVRLVQTVFPEQYNTRPWALRKWVAGFLVRRLLHPIVPGLVDKHAFLLTQFPDLSFTEIERRKLKTDRNVRTMGWALVALLLAGPVAVILSLK